MAQKTELLEVDLLNMKPIPGASLTEEPGKRPYERPPQITKPDKALQYCLNGMLGNEEVRDELFDVLDMGISVETVASAFILQSFTEGVFDPNISELIKVPLIQFITQEAAKAGIEDMNIVNTDMPKQIQIEDKLQVMQSLNPQKFKRLREEGMQDVASMMDIKDEMNIEEVSMPEGFINRRDMEMAQDG